MKKLTLYSHIFLFVLTLTLPLAFYLSGLNATLKLEGVVVKDSKSRFTWTNLVEGKFQRRFEQNLKHISGLQPLLVRTDNQLNYSFFHQISTSYEGKVVAGNGNELIEKAYLSQANKLDAVDLNKLKQKVKSLKFLQDELSRRGVAFLLLISPNKPTLYPEIIPAGYRVENRDSRLSRHELMIPLLVEERVNFIDGPKLFDDIKRSDVRLFASSGTHWNEYGSCIIADVLRERVEALLDKKLSKFSCRYVGNRAVPIAQDRDLTEIANLWFPEMTYSQNPRPENLLLEKGEKPAPNVVWVGTSFSWGPFRFLDKHHVFNSREMYYYFKRRDSYPSGLSRSVVKEKIDWESEVFNKDIVIFEVNEAFLHRAGYGFDKFANRHISLVNSKHN
ncbi:MAG: hypothetical protein KDD53_10215 [Bdellovibrionales bacterium]|nr:hypothetical protein [Bdellovibrionales bacterium]